MGLASAMSTALTGLTAAETTIDVVGNNLANANTVGFKASEATFATQFLQTKSLGSSPTTGSGGTNPRQIGLGALVSAISPSFTQGTIEISANATDLAIQGDGFFIVQGSQGEELYSRNGIFKLNSQSELVTTTGNRLLGYGVDEDYQVQATVLEPLTIPLGSAAVAKATENVYLEGTLSPTGDLADTAEVIQTGVLGDSQWSQPTTSPDLLIASTPDITAMPTPSPNTTGGTVGTGDYYYKIVYADGPLGGSPESEGMASTYTAMVSVNNGAGEDCVDISGWPIPNPADPSIDHYSYVRVYRCTDGANPDTDPFYLVGESTIGAVVGDTTITDTFNDADFAASPADHPVLDQTDLLSGAYSYYVTFYNSATGRESVPCTLSGPLIINDGRIHLNDIPVGNAAEWTDTRIYRNTATDTGAFYRVAELDGVAGGTYTDSIADSVIELNPEIDLDGPKITASTLVLDMVSRDGSTYSHVFDGPGTLQFSGRKGDRTLQMKEFDITATTTVLELYEFMSDALGIQSPPGPDSTNPIPASEGVYGGNAGGEVTADGRILLRGNNGESNAISVGLSGLMFVAAGGTEENVNLPFTSVQAAKGESAVADFIAYDSLGIDVSVRITTVLEARTSTATTYRWYADSPDNDPDSGSEIAVGTGLISFDGDGNFVSATETTVSVDRRHVSSASPLEFELDFNQLSGLAADESTLAVSRQDGSAPGTLTSYIVGEDGKISGVFSNGITRDLGQIILARFANPTGLEQKGENMFAAGVNSGLPVIGRPNEQGIGSIIAGAQELSNTDIGGNLIDLILASTMYRGNTRVITTAQEMFDELLALNR